jgi:hypothetical protein
MDKIEKYRQIIIDILGNYKEILSRRKNPPLESVFIFDEQNNNYTWLKFGWQDGSRFEGITVFVRIKDGKFYIEEDWTENGIAAELLEKGVSPKDIVLAFQKSENREFLEFALN